MALSIIYTMAPTPLLIVICGPTGIGKTSLAIQVAKHLDCEIISADSRQLYKEMSIGTAVPGTSELSQVKHHFIQSHSIHSYYNASKYEEEVLEFLNSYFNKSKLVVMVGGSGLYIDAVCKGIDDLPTIDAETRKKWDNKYKTEGLASIQDLLKNCDPDHYAQVDLNNYKRILKALEVHDITGKPYSSFLKHTLKKRDFKIIRIGLNTARDTLYDQINQRVDKMVESGLVQEARELLPFRELTPLKTVGYKELFEYFDGKISMSEAITHIKNHSRAYARRQITWFRRDKEIKWFEPGDPTSIIAWVDAQIATNG